MDLLSSCLHKKSDKHKINSDNIRSSIMFMQKENFNKLDSNDNCSKNDKKSHCKSSKQNPKLKADDISPPLKNILDPRIMKNCQSMSHIKLPKTKDNWKLHRSNDFDSNERYCQTLPRSYTTSPTSNFEQFKFDPNDLQRSRTMSPVPFKNDHHTLPNIFHSNGPPYQCNGNSKIAKAPSTGMLKHAVKYQMRKTPTFDDFIHSPSTVNPLETDTKVMHKRSKSIGDLKGSQSRDPSPESKHSTLEHTSRGLQRSCPIDCCDPKHPHSRSRSQGNQPGRTLIRQANHIRMTEESLYDHGQVYGMPQSRRFSKDIDELARYNPIYRWYESDADADSGIVSSLSESVSSRGRGSNQDSFRSISSKASSATSRGYGTDSEQGNFHDCYDPENEEDYLDYAPQAELMRIKSRMYTNYSSRQQITLENGVVIPAPPNFPPPPIPDTDPYMCYQAEHRFTNFCDKDHLTHSSFNNVASRKTNDYSTAGQNEPTSLPERMGCLRTRPMSPEGNKETTKRVVFADSVSTPGIRDDSNLSNYSESKNIHINKSHLNRSNSLPKMKRDKHMELAMKQEALSSRGDEELHNYNSNNGASSNKISNGYNSSLTQRSFAKKPPLSPVYEPNSLYLQKSNQVTEFSVDSPYQKDYNKTISLMRGNHLNERYNTESVHL